VCPPGQYLACPLVTDGKANVLTRTVGDRILVSSTRHQRIAVVLNQPQTGERAKRKG
jgi:hypothetical protein